MRYRIKHKTTYSYQRSVSVSQHLLHLRPRELPNQKLHETKLTVEPQPSTLSERTDFYGNTAGFVAIETPHTSLCVTSQSVVTIQAPTLPAPGKTPAWTTVRQAFSQDTPPPDTAPGEFLFDSPHIELHPRYREYASASFKQGSPLLEAVLDLNSRIYRDFTFDRRATNVATPLSEVFRKRRGVCQDFAHLAIACLRATGIPARYVSGYIETLPPPGKPKLEGADASHAWFSFWCGAHGWIDVDPTNNIPAADRHVTVAWGRDFSDVSPVRGVVIGGGDHEVNVAVDVIALS